MDSKRPAKSKEVTTPYYHAEQVRGGPVPPEIAPETCNWIGTERKKGWNRLKVKIICVSKTLYMWSQQVLGFPFLGHRKQKCSVSNKNGNLLWEPNLLTQAIGGFSRDITFYNLVSCPLSVHRVANLSLLSLFCFWGSGGPWVTQSYDTDILPVCHPQWLLLWWPHPQPAAPFSATLNLPSLNSGEIQCFLIHNILHSTAVVNTALIAGSKTLVEVFYSALP